MGKTISVARLCLGLVLLLCVPAVLAQETGKGPVAVARGKLAAAEATHPGNTVEVAEAIDDLIAAQIDAQVADPETLKLAQRQLAVAEAAAGQRSKAYANALASVGQAYTALDRANEGRPHAERALELARSLFPDTADLATLAHALSEVCLSLGDFKCSLEADQTAVAVFRKMLGNSNMRLAGALSNIAYAKYQTADLAGAGAAMEEAVEVGWRADPKDPRLGTLENNLGAFYTRTGNMTGAILHLTKALDLLKAQYGADSLIVSMLIGNLADLYSRTGDTGRAWPLFDSAVLSYERRLGRMHSETANLYATYSRSLASGGSLTLATRYALEAERASREVFILSAQTLPERQALAYDKARAHGLDVAITVMARQRGAASVEVYEEMIRSRALVADEMARRQRNLNRTNDPVTTGLLQQLDKARSGVLALEQSQEANGEARAAATAQMEQAERALAEHSAVFRKGQRQAAVDFASLRKSLPERSALVSYVRYYRYIVSALDNKADPTPAYGAFVVSSRGGQLRFYDFGLAKPIDELVGRMRQSVEAETASGGLSSTRNERSFREAALALRTKIWDPLKADLDGAALLLVVPDGMLNLVPFAALPDGKTYLVERAPVIHMLSSERDLIPVEAGAAKAGLLAIGGPAYEEAQPLSELAALRSAELSCDEFRQAHFAALPGAMAEIADIAGTWSRYNQAEASARYIGLEATRDRFLQEATRHRVVHVATHAFLLPAACGGGNPLLRSGLVFAGANSARQSSLLTAQEIAGLDLEGVDWAVLSACNTGNGELNDGEGVLGLQRAFRIAGARSIVMSLWSVNDDATRRFMRELYAQRLGRRTATAQAIWTSSRTLLQRRRAAGQSTHPWYWAGFVGSGDWR